MIMLATLSALAMKEMRGRGAPPSAASDRRRRNGAPPNEFFAAEKTMIIYFKLFTYIIRIEKVYFYQYMDNLLELADFQIHFR